VGADLLLRARELWRRNGEGSLWVPPVWPRSVAAAFWPLVLVAVLVLAGLALGLGSRRVPQPAAPAAELESAAPEAESVPSRQPEEPSLLSPSIATPSPGVEAEPETGNLAESEPEPKPEPEPEPEPALDPVSVPSPEPGPDEALRNEFAALDAMGVIVAARPDPVTAALQVEVNEGFARLEPRRRRHLAEAWAVLATDRGYERLEVVDGRGRLWARPAAVGGGLVVLGYPVEPEPG